MNIFEYLYMAETAGELPTRTGKLNAIIRDIKKVPSPTIDEDTFIAILNKNGFELKDLSQKEFNYILNGIK